jgi:hypothetical protein
MMLLNAAVVSIWFLVMCKLCGQCDLTGFVNWGESFAKGPAEEWPQGNILSFIVC